MFSQPRRGRRKGPGVSSLQRASILFGLALIMLSSMSGSLAGLEEAWAQDDPAATEIPELVDDPPVEEEQKPEEQAPEEPKPTEPVKEEPQPTDIPKTEAPDQVAEPPVETKIVETEAVATEAASSPKEDSEKEDSEKEDSEFGSTSQALWASNELEITVHGCPAGVDAAASSPAQLEAACGDNVGPVSFWLDNDWRGTFYFLTSGGPDNQASFNGLDFEDDYFAANAGEGRPVVVAAPLPSGYASIVVSCTYWNEAAGATDWGPAIMAMRGGRAIEIAVDAGDTLACDWYFLPPLYQGEDSANVDIPDIAPTADPQETPSPTPDDSRPIQPVEPIEPIDPRPTFPGGFDPIINLRPTEIPVQPTQPGIPLPEPITGTVTVTKYTCPEGVVRSDESFRLYEQCQENVGPVEFTVRGKGGYGQVAFADGSIPRAAVFTGVPHGQIEISETIPPGYGKPLAFCSDRMGGVVPPVPVDGNTVTWNLRPAAGNALRCIFFNFLEKADGLGVQRGWAQEGLEIAEATGTPETGVVVPAPTEPVPQLVEPTVISIEPGIEPTATEVPDPTEIPAPTAIADDVIPIVIPGGDTPTEPGAAPATGRVTVVKLTCAVDIARSDVLSTLFEQCNENPGPVELSVTDDGGYSRSAYTPDDVRQIVAFADVPFGMINISETVPPGYGVPMAFCSDSAADGFGTFMSVPVSGGTAIFVEHRADAEDELRCVYVNFPAGGIETEPETGTVRVVKITCPAGTARTGVDYVAGDLCSVNSGPVEFSLTGADGYVAAAFTGGSEGQSLAFIDVPIGAFELTETVPAGYGQPLGYCAVPGGDGAVEYVPVPVADGDTISWELRVDTGIEQECYFVNFMEGGEDIEPETGTVRVSKYTCPEGVARSDDDYLLSEQCREDVAPVDFTVSDGGFTLDQTQTASPGVPQDVTFTGVPFGSIAISESVPAGYGTPQVFCTDTPADGPGAYEPVEVVFASAVVWELRADAEIPLTCLFFNFLEEGEPEGNQLTVTKFDCPEGTDRGLGLPDLGTTCDVIGGIEFTATYGGSSSTVTTDGGGNALWTDVPAGAWSLREAIPAGYADPKVYCGPMFTTGAPEVAAPGGLFAGEFAGAGTGEHMVCTVFNFQDGEDPGTGTVRVTKYTCPVGVERSEDDYALSQACLEDVDPVEFSVRDETIYATSLTATSGVPQGAEFTGVPFGPIRIWETIPTGYGEPLVFCTDTPVDGAGNYEPVPVVDGDTVSWDLGADAGIPLACLFFNFTDGNDDGNVVTLQKWTCGPETIYGQSSEYYYDTCTVAGDEDFTFTLTDAVGSHPQVTAGGWVTWTDVPVGPIGIQESIPSAYGEPIVLCSDGTGADFRDAPTGYIDHEFTGSGQEFICDWFNLIGEGSGLTVVKFTCPEGYDLHAAGADPTVDCPEPTNGVTFTLDLPDATAFLTTTGDAAEGQIQFGGLPPGSYTLTETVPAGIASSFVLDCYGNRLGGIRPYPLATGDTLNLDINAGESITCLWYNVPEGNDTSLTLVKYTCATVTYVSDVDCQIDETGQTFDLVFWNGAAWEYHSTATTDGLGRIHWTGLNPLDYWLDEQAGDWCHLASEQLSDDGNRLALYEGEETVVEVYNCDGVPGQPGETPTRYPNTGVPPSVRDDRRLQP